jgi:hypothetical protein
LALRASDVRCFAAAHSAGVCGYPCGDLLVGVELLPADQVQALRQTALAEAQLARHRPILSELPYPLVYGIQQERPREILSFAVV